VSGATLRRCTSIFASVTVVVYDVFVDGVAVYQLTENIGHTG
jgi:hypothetical protein